MATGGTGGIDEAMDHSARLHKRSPRRSRLMQRSRIAVLLVVGVFGLGFLWFAFTSSGSPSEDPPQRSATAAPDLSLGEAIAQGAKPLCVEQGPPATVHVPAAFGRVDRIAVSSDDLERTLWEVKSSRGTAERVFELGKTPSGFTEVRPVGSKGWPPSGFIVVNGEGGYGLALLQTKRRVQLGHPRAWPGLAYPRRSWTSAPTSASA